MSSCTPCNASASYLTTQPNLTGPLYQNAGGCGVAPYCPSPIESNICDTNQYSTSVLTTSYSQPQVQGVHANKEYLDIGIFNDYMFGIRITDPVSGGTAISQIPQWAIGWCFEDTPPNSPGRLLNDCFTLPNLKGRWRRYIKTKSNGDVRIYIKNVDDGKELEEGEFNSLIPNCAIKDLDASKLTNLCSIYARTTDPIRNYFNTSGVLASGTSLLPIVYSDSTDCRLSALLKCNIVRGCVIPSLTSAKGPLWDYNPDLDTAPVFKPENLDCLINVCIDGETIRPATRGGAGQVGETRGGAGDRPNGKILTSFTYVNSEYLTGDGTKANPIDIKDNSLNGNVIKKCDNLSPSFIDLTGYNFSGSWSFFNGSVNWSQGGGVGGVYGMDFSGGDSISLNPNFDGGGAPTPSITGNKGFSFRTPDIDCSNKSWLAELSLVYRHIGQTRGGASFNNFRAGIDNLTNAKIIPDNRDKITLFADFVDDSGAMDGAGVSSSGSTFIELAENSTINGRLFSECVFPNNFSTPPVNREFLGFVSINIKILGAINKTL